MILILTLSILAVSACGSATSDIAKNNNAPAVETAAESGEIKQVSVEEAKTATDSENAQFIDVRTAEEYAGGHARKAVNMPLDELENYIAKLDREKPVYVICETGRRSQRASEQLQKAGFSDVYNVEGGTSAWIEAGLPTEK